MSERFVQMSDATGEVLPKASTRVDFTLSNGAWVAPTSEQTYYTQTVENASSLITATTDGIFALAQNASNTEYEAAAEAQLRCIGQNASNGGTLVIAAKEQPTVDIPCTVILMG